MEKKKVFSFFGGLNGASLNGTQLNAGNIDDFDLYILFESDMGDIYKKNKNDKIFLVKFKENHYVSWKTEPRSWKGSVDWYESGLSELINDFKSKSKNYTDYRYIKNKKI